MKVEILSKSFEGDPATVVPEALQEMAGQLKSELGKREAGEAEVQALSRAINDEVLPALKAIKDEQRELAREVPGPDAGEQPFKLGKMNLRMSVSEQERQDREVGSALASLSREQYSLLTQDIRTLGVDDDRAVKAVKRFRHLHDKLALTHVRFSSNPSQFPNYRGWESLPDADEYKELGRKFMGTTGLADHASGQGTEFVPVNILSGDIYDRIAIELQVANVLQSFTMAGPTVKRAAKGTMATSTYTAENYVGLSGGTQNLDYPPDSVDVTFTAKKQTALAAVSEEYEQDSIMGPGGVMDELAYALAYGKENALVNGQLTGTTADAAGSLDTGVVLATGDMRLFCNGIRKLFALTASSAQDMSTGVTAELLAGVWASQGKYGSPRNGAWIVETSGLARLMTASAKDGSPMFLTAAAAGADATNIRGVLGSVFGRPVILSDLIPTTLDATGIIPDPPGALTGIYHINRRALMIGERAGVAVSMSPHARFTYGQNVYRAVSRWDVQPMFAAATNKIIGAGLGVATF